MTEIGNIVNKFKWILFDALVRPPPRTERPLKMNALFLPDRKGDLHIVKTLLKYGKMISVRSKK